jgi:hypothetical protein
MMGERERGDEEEGGGGKGESEVMMGSIQRRVWGDQKEGRTVTTIQRIYQNSTL